MIHFVDVRCDGLAMKGPRKGMSCNYLLFRIDPDSQATIESKCTRCNALRIWAFPREPVLVSL